MKYSIQEPDLIVSTSLLLYNFGTEHTSLSLRKSFVALVLGLNGNFSQSFEIFLKKISKKKVFKKSFKEENSFFAEIDNDGDESEKFNKKNERKKKKFF
jgi:hypothetical protein